MNFFIVVDMFIAVSFFGTDVSALRVKRLAQIASKYVPMAYNDVPKIWLDSQHGNAIIHWIRNGEPENDRFTIDKKGTFVIDGYTTNILRNKTQADSALAKLSVKNKYLKMDESTGGVAAFAWATPRGDLFAWSTQPAAHGIYWSKGDDFIVAGTRPLIVHLVARESDYPLLTSADIDVRLTAGSLITHSTHYEGVRRLQPLKALAIGTGGCTEIEYPIRDEKEFNSKMPHEFYAEHLVNALSSAVSPFKGSSVNVLMSGGKDSRTITATCYGNNIRTKGIVYDAEGGEESTVAQLMANAVGSTLEVRRQRIYADPIEGSLRSHMRTEGLLTAVPHQITFAEQEKFDGPVLHGHGHLLRGGFASTMSPDVDYIKKVAVAPYSSGWIRAEASRKVQNYLSDWMVMRGKGDFRNLQYWSHHDLRCGVHQAPGILDYDGTNRMIYPLLDDKLVRLSNRIPLFYKVRELSVFSAIKAFAPKVAELPLYGEMWRFEAKEELDGYPGRDKRATAVDKNHTVSRGGGTVSLGRPQVRDTDHISADYIMSSRIFSEIKPMLTDRMVNIIESYASGLGLPQRERETHLPSQRSARRKMLEVFGLCTLFEGQWLRPYRAERDLSEFTVL